MSVFIRRYGFSRCMDLVRQSNPSIGIQGGFGFVYRIRCASTLCSKYTVAPFVRTADATASINYTPIRFKSNKKDDKRKQVEDDDDDSDEDSDAELSKFSKPGSIDKNLIRIKVQSLRLDLLIKSTLRISRNKIEKIFYESKIRVNGKKILKKSMMVREGDEIDVIKQFTPDNPENLLISRVEMLSARVDDDEEHIIIIARRFKSLVIENYPGLNCYKSSESDS